MMNFQTEIPVKYEDLTPENKKEICNGCGGKGGFVKPPHRIFFKTSCNHHDYGYWRGCTAPDRKQADQMLYKKMIEDCSTIGMVSWLRYRPWCWLYYQAVRMFGAKFFYFGDKKRYPA